MKKILIFGSGGMLGHVCLNYFLNLNKYNVYGTSSLTNSLPNTFSIDVKSKSSIKEVLLKIKPDIVINCIGILVNNSKENIEDAILINSLFPNILSKFSQILNYKLIHISTDCVFSGKIGNYTEDSFRDGDTIYARSKALGEIIDNKNLTIRTSIIGPEIKKEGTGLFHWFYQQKGNINGFQNVYWTGVTTLELAKAIEEFIKQDITGLYNFTPKNKISKYDLLVLFQKIWAKNNVIITPEIIHKSDKSLLTKRKDFSYIVKSYEEMLIDLYNWMKSNKNLYPNYLK